MTNRELLRRAGDQFGAQDWDGLVVIASGMSWDDTRLSEKQLALHLSSLVPVLFVDPAISLLTPLRKPALRASTMGPPLRMVQPNIARLTPITVPGIGRRGLRELGEWVTRRAIARSVRRLSANVAAIVVANLDDVLDSCAAEVKVLYGTDDWSSGGGLMNISSRWLRRREPLQLSRADVVVAVSEQLAARWSTDARPVDVIPNGCDTEHFSNVDEVSPAPEVTLPDPIAGFIGHLSDRIDIDVLERVAESGASLLLIGPRQLTFDLDRMTALLAHRNVQWVGPQPFERLPSFMKRISVGLTPYTDSDFNRSSDPLKTLEYLAAGRAAVVSDLPSTRRIPSDLIDVCSSAESFVERTLAALAREPDQALADRRREYARSQNWDARTREFVRVIESHRPQA